MSFARGATIGRSRLPRVDQGFWVPIPCLVQIGLRSPSREGNTTKSGARFKREALLYAMGRRL
jgi:hypothetical protein